MLSDPELQWEMIVQDRERSAHVFALTSPRMSALNMHIHYGITHTHTQTHRYTSTHTLHSSPYSPAKSLSPAVTWPAAFEVASLPTQLTVPCEHIHTDAHTHTCMGAYINTHIPSLARNAN